MDPKAVPVTWFSSDKTLTFEFLPSEDSSGKFESLRVYAFLSTNPAEKCQETMVLDGSPAWLSYLFTGSVRLHGFLKAIPGPQENTLLVWGDFSYGVDEEVEDFEGALVELKLNQN